MQTAQRIIINIIIVIIACVITTTTIISNITARTNKNNHQQNYVLQISYRDAVGVNQFEFVTLQLICNAMMKKQNEEQRIRRIWQLHKTSTCTRQLVQNKFLIDTRVKIYRN